MLSKDPTLNGSAVPNPTEIDGKIEGLIASQVEAGKLTSDQADTLRDFLSGDDEDADLPDGAQGFDVSNGEAEASRLDPNELIASFLKGIADQRNPPARYNLIGEQPSRPMSPPLLPDLQT
jgi:hypothetical protein